MVQTTKKATTDPHGAGAAAALEAEIRAKARPMLSKEERVKEGAKSSLLGVQMAAARAREAAAQQIVRAEEWEAQAAALAKQTGE